MFAKLWALIRETYEYYMNNWYRLKSWRYIDFMHYINCTYRVKNEIYILKSSIYWDITLCSPLKVSRRFRGTYRSLLQGRMSRARYEHESRWQAETSVDFQRTTQRYIPEDRTPHNHRCEDLKFYRYDSLFSLEISGFPLFYKTILAWMHGAAYIATENLSVNHTHESRILRVTLVCLKWEVLKM
jgi:hypothetical protein